MIDSISSPLQAPQIGSTSPSSAVQKQQPAAETQVVEKKDSLEISSQAEQLSKTTNTGTMRQIQTQVNTGFYNRPDVVRQVASRIADEIFPREINS